jgi:hypothetical protein
MDNMSNLVLPNTNPAPKNGMNGRVNLSEAPSAGGHAEVPGFSYRTSAERSFATDALRGNWEVTLAKAFFSEKNMQAVQNAIRKAVYEKSGPKKYVIDDQSADELTIIMRTMYLQYAQNLPYDIPGQVTDLNEKVLNWIYCMLNHNLVTTRPKLCLKHIVYFPLNQKPDRSLKYVVHREYGFYK